MVFDDAMASHIIWKLRLAKFVAGLDDEAIDTAAAARTDLCGLGKWISDEGERFCAVPAYVGLVQKHADFHRYASDAVARAEKGDRAGAREVIDGPLEAASRDVVRAIVALRNALTSDQPTA